MTYTEFMRGLAKYYGPYESPKKAEMVDHYLKDEFIEGELAALLDQIYRSYSGQFKYTPDIAIIEKAKENHNRAGYAIGKGRARDSYFKLPARQRPREMQKVGDLAKELIENLSKLNNMGDQTDE